MLCFNTAKTKEKNRFVETGVSATQFFSVVGCGVTAMQFGQLLSWCFNYDVFDIKSIFDLRCFSNGILQSRLFLTYGVSATLCFDVKTIFGLRCFNNTLF